MTIVDDDDFERLVGMGSWHLSSTGYAVRRPNVNGQTLTVRMHRLLTDAPRDMVVDHINRNPLDNRRSNLRVVTQLINNRNRDRGLGVWFHSQNRNWIVELCNVHIGCFTDEGLAYQIAEMIRNNELPLGRIKITNHLCKRGHNKQIVGTYKISGTDCCRTCILENQAKYYRRKNGRN